VTRQAAAEFHKIETEFKRDCDTAINNDGTALADRLIQELLRWLADPRNVGKRFGWTLTKMEAPKVD
jgi:hypothetical protein